MKLAILQVADTGPLESLVVMLRTAGYETCLPNDKLKRELRSLGCDTVLDIDSLVRGMGYDWPIELPEAGVADMALPGVVYVDVKAHRNAERIWRKWPNLQVLWYRINGGKPEVVQGCGDEINPPCPVLTPNRWYGLNENYIYDESDKCHEKAYCCWPPFYRFNNYRFPRADGRPPICLIHNLAGWGYAALVETFRRKLGIQCYGAGSPDGLLTHEMVPNLLRHALCMVHLKSSDAPGYAIYEALAAACPIICTRRLIWRCRMQELLIPDETCHVFDRETHEGLTAEDVRSCTEEVAHHLEALKDPGENKRIGEAGRKRLLELMWSPNRSSDVASLRAFMDWHFT